jgi:hypothetical protein
VTVLHDLNVGLTQAQYVSIEVYIRDLSYKVLELFHQGIIFLGKVAGIYSKAARSAHVRRMTVSMRHWLAVFRKRFREQSNCRLGDQRCNKKGSENSHHGQQHIQMLGTKTAPAWTCAILEPNALTVIITRKGEREGA